MTRALLVAGLALLLAATAACSGDSGYYTGTYDEPAPQPGGPDGDTGFKPPVRASEQPDSTFALDIDTASYSYARRLILEGSPVDPGTVRPEEFINAFTQDYPEPDDDGFTVTLDGARLDDGSHLLRVGLRTRSVDPAARGPVALTFVVDVSGSMAEAGRLDLVQDALHYLVDQLRPTDSVAIVAYDDEARVLREMTAASDRAALHGAIDDLAPGGSTNLESGLVTGYRVARDGFVAGAGNRVIILSDGLANVGSTTADPILAQIREEAAKQITLLGVGVGSDYGDELMERLADEGDGFVTYVADRDQARRVFVEQLPASLELRALDAKVQVTFDPAVVDTYRLVGYDNRLLSSADFRDDRVDGGEVGPGHSVTALYVLTLKEGVGGSVATARVRWLDPTTRAASEAATVLPRPDTALAAASPRLRVAYAAGFFAEVLRGSPYAEAVTLDGLAEIAADAAGETADPDVAELAQLIRASR